MRVHSVAKPVLRGTSLMQSEHVFLGLLFSADGCLPVRFLNIQEYAAKGK